MVHCIPSSFSLGGLDNYLFSEDKSNNAIISVMVLLVAQFLCQCLQLSSVETVWHDGTVFYKSVTCVE